MNAHAPIAGKGHNNPPSPIEEIQSSYDGLFLEIGNWLDGNAVDDAEGLRAVENLRSDLKAAKKDATDSKEAEYRPHKDAGHAVIQAWKPFLADLARMDEGLLEAMRSFKLAQAEAEKAAQREAYRKADEARREAEEAARTVRASDLEARREADAAAQAAMDAQKAATRAKPTTKGLRTVWKHEIQDQRAAINWIARNDRDAMGAFLAEYVRRNFRDVEIAGVRKWSTKEAF